MKASTRLQDDFITRLYKASDIQPSSALATTLVNFVNECYKVEVDNEAERCDMSGNRFERPEEVHDMLGTEGLFAVTWCSEEVVACAAVVPLLGDYEGCRFRDGGKETGWEVKTVAVKMGYMKQGLAGRCIAVLQKHILKQQRTDSVAETGKKTSRLWIQTAEDVNGAYWRRRGWLDVRSYEKPPGFWGSYYGFRLLILAKEISETMED